MAADTRRGDVSGGSKVPISGVARERNAGTETAVSAVLPAYNEAAIIEETVRHIAEVLGGLTDSFEVIVVSDGSVDATGAILTRLQQDNPELHLHVVTHPAN